MHSQSRPALQPGCYRAPVEGQAFYWDGTNMNGEEVASGQYLALLRTGDSTSLINLALIRGTGE